KPGQINVNLVEELDLAPMGVYATIRVPQGVEMDGRSGATLKGEHGFHLSISEEPKDLAEIKKSFQGPGRRSKLKKAHVDAPGALLLETDERQPTFYVFVNVKFEAITYHCATWLGYRTLDDAKKVMACAQTLRQSARHKKALAAIAAGRKALDRKGHILTT